MKALFPRPAMFDEARAKKSGHNIIIEILIFLLVFFIGGMIEGMILGVPYVMWIFGGTSILSDVSEAAMEYAQTLDMTSYITKVTEIIETALSSTPAWLTLIELFATAGLIFTAILYCRLIEKRDIASMGLRKKNALREYLVGLGVGALMICGAVVIGVLTGALKLSAGKFGFGLWIVFLLGFVVQGMSEEILCRGYFMVSVARKYPVWVGVVLNSVVFGMLHLANPGMTLLSFVNLILAGLVFSVYVVRRGDLWGACAMHTIWNFVQGNVFGVKVSGLGMSSSIFSAESVEGLEIWNGGAFGLEGGLAVTIIEAVTLLIILFLVPSVKASEEK